MIGFCAIFRFYPVWRLVDPLIAMLWLAPIAIPAVLLYFWVIDRQMHDPKDAYWEMGALVALRGRLPDWNRLKDFALGWTVKGIFLPVMFSYLSANMPSLTANAGQIANGPVAAVVYLSQIMVVMELTIVVVGYTMMARLFDAHIRSANPYLFAWIVTLICYEPLNQIVTLRVFNYHTGRNWDAVISDYPILFWPWVILILLSFIIWVWATAIFGLRWSNLTNRYIITNGPYRFCKHPDYISKSCFFWLTAAPFLTAFTLWQGLVASLGLIVVNLIYLGRAKAEERHLSQYPAYVRYALEMNQRSIFRPLGRCFPFLVYSPPVEKD